MFCLVFRPPDNAQLEALANKTVISLISGKNPKWLNHMAGILYKYYLREIHHVK